jgi:hypothetical protein
MSSLLGRLTRRQMLACSGKALLAYPALNFAALMVSCGGGSSVSHQNHGLSDDQFLDQIERANFLYFWEQASSSTGLVKDRALAAGNDNRTVASIAATGFGLSALCIGHKRGYGDTTQIQSRVTTTLNYLLNQFTNVNGFFYHYVDMNSGARRNQRTLFDRHRDPPLWRAHLP